MTPSHIPMGECAQFEALVSQTPDPSESSFEDFVSEALRYITSQEIDRAVVERLPLPIRIGQP